MTFLNCKDKFILWIEQHLEKLRNIFVLTPYFTRYESISLTVKIMVSLDAEYLGDLIGTKNTRQAIRLAG